MAEYIASCGETLCDVNLYKNSMFILDGPDASSAPAMPEAADELAMADSLNIGQYGTADVLAGASANSLAELDCMSDWQNLAALAERSAGTNEETIRLRDHGSGGIVLSALPSLTEQDDPSPFANWPDEFSRTVNTEHKKLPFLPLSLPPLFSLPHMMMRAFL